MSEALAMWTLYFDPMDAPNQYVARQFLVADGKTIATDNAVTMKRPDSFRQAMLRHGRIKFQRAESDDPCIVETWL